MNFKVYSLLICKNKLVHLLVAKFRASERCTIKIKLGVGSKASVQIAKK